MVALTSLPGVTVKLNWREWRVLQARTGWLAFVAATVGMEGHFRHCDLLFAQDARLPCSLCRQTSMCAQRLPQQFRPFMQSTWLTAHTTAVVRTSILSWCVSCHASLHSVFMAYRTCCQHTVQPHLRLLLSSAHPPIPFLLLQVHTLLLGAPWWKLAKSEWPSTIPTSTLLCVAPVALLLLLKGLISLPPGSWMLGRVHSGGSCQCCQQLEA
jgi:hypothetical protein